MNIALNSKSVTFSLDTLNTIAHDLYVLKNQCAIYTFEGPLGAGKTTLVRSLFKQFDIHAPITSPTFSYMNVYENNKGELLYHFDLYRLTNLNEFLEAGFDEFLYVPNSWAFIEWPKIIKSLLTKNVCDITLDYGADQQHRILQCSIR